VRYILLAIVILGDCVLMLVGGTLVWYTVENPILVPLTALLLLAAWRSFQSQGGFRLYSRAAVRSYLQNARRLGL